MTEATFSIDKIQGGLHSRKERRFQIGILFALQIKI